MAHKDQCVCWDTKHALHRRGCPFDFLGGLFVVVVGAGIVFMVLLKLAGK